MIFPSSDISKHLKNLGLSDTETIMIHGDAGVAAQYIFENSSNSIQSFIFELLDFFKKGTIIVPTFTYSATRGEVFNPNKTPSKIGQFSDEFRLIKGALRSSHPIFSVSCVGKHAEYFVDSKMTDCFGKDTLFDKLYKNNVKILALGCSIDRITFVHFVEQSLNVPYRYFKNFKAKIKKQNIVEEVDVRYFVRKLDFNRSLNLSDFEQKAIGLKKLTKCSFGRFSSSLISSKDFFDISSLLLKNNEYALTVKRNHE